MFCCRGGEPNQSLSYKNKDDIGDAQGQGEQEHTHTYDFMYAYLHIYIHIYMYVFPYSTTNQQNLEQYGIHQGKVHPDNW